MSGGSESDQVGDELSELLPDEGIAHSTATTTWYRTTRGVTRARDRLRPRAFVTHLICQPIAGRWSSLPGKEDGGEPPLRGVAEKADADLVVAAVGHVAIAAGTIDPALVELRGQSDRLFRRFGNERGLVAG